MGRERVGNREEGEGRGGRGVVQRDGKGSEGKRRGVVVSGVRRMNEVNARRARLLPGWVTVFGRVHHLGM